jgi:DNA-binding XRE family transcriptional regulator
MDDFERHLNKRLQEDPEFKKLWEDDAVRREIVGKLVEIRIKNDLTQKELANRLGTSQSAIARIESGKGNPSINFLIKLGQVLGKKLEVNFV